MKRRTGVMRSTLLMCWPCGSEFMPLGAAWCPSRRYFEAAPGWITVITPLAHWRAQDLSEQGLGHVAQLGVRGYARDQRATVTADQDRVIAHIGCRNPAQLIEHLQGAGQTRCKIGFRQSLLVRHAPPDLT